MGVAMWAWLCGCMGMAVWAWQERRVLVEVLHNYLIRKVHYNQNESRFTIK